MVSLRSAGLPSNDYAFKNMIYVSPSVFSILLTQSGLAKTEVLDVKIKQYIIKLGQLSEDQVDDMHFAVSGPYREMLGISKLDDVEIEPIKVKRNKLLSHVDFSVDVMSVTNNKKGEVIEVVESELEKLLREHTVDLIFNKNQIFLVKSSDYILKCTINKIELVSNKDDSKSKRRYGWIEKETELSFKMSTNSAKAMKIKSDKLKEKEIFKKNFNFQEMGIGGLDKEFQEIFRRAFNSRRYPQIVLDKYGIKHVKGMLLYGPPGTGKTLIARQIAQALE